jgi:hypothetical protein
VLATIMANKFLDFGPSFIHYQAELCTGFQFVDFLFYMANFIDYQLILNYAKLIAMDICYVLQDFRLILIIAPHLLGCFIF